MFKTAQNTSPKSSAMVAVLGKQAALSSSSFKVSERRGHPVGHVVFVEKSQFFFNDSAGEC